MVAMKISHRMLIALAFLAFPLTAQSGVTVDHNCIDLTKVPTTWITQAKQKLHIAYGHTSHGSQVTTGMSGLVNFTGGVGGPQFAWNNGGTGGALDLHDNAMKGDVGYYPQWVNETKAYLDNPANKDVNVIIWSWCGQHASRTQQTMISTYLAPMEQLQAKYPQVTFVYMTGHLNAPGGWQNTQDRNQQIRSWCKAKGYVLYDFADIESYDPDGKHYPYGDDSCDYYNASFVKQGNWAVNWQNSHLQGKDWYVCSSAHSQPLNANMKAYAAWWLWARLAGWSGPSGSGACPGTGNVVPVLAGVGTPTVGNSSFTLALSHGHALSSFIILAGRISAAQVIAGGCTLAVGPPYMPFTGYLDNAGQASYPLPIPNDINLLGSHVYLQAYINDKQGAVGPGFFSSTAGLAVRVQ
jgi:hypothetical protein